MMVPDQAYMSWSNDVIIVRSTTMKPRPAIATTKILWPLHTVSLSRRRFFIFSEKRLTCHARLTLTGAFAAGTTACPDTEASSCA